MENSILGDLSITCIYFWSTYFSEVQWCAIYFIIINYFYYYHRCCHCALAYLCLRDFFGKERCKRRGILVKRTGPERQWCAQVGNVEWRVHGSVNFWAFSVVIIKSLQATRNWLLSRPQMGQKSGFSVYWGLLPMF